MSAQHARAPDATVISWDVEEKTLTDGSLVYDVVGTSDECRVTFHCVSDRAAEALAEELRSDMIVGAIAERLPAVMSEKTCSRCREGERLADLMLDASTAIAGAYRSAFLGIEPVRQHVERGAERRVDQYTAEVIHQWLGDIDARQKPRRFLP